MVVKTSLKIILVGILLYGGWYVYSFIHAWAGIGIIAATFIWLAAYVEKKVKETDEKK